MRPKKLQPLSSEVDPLRTLPFALVSQGFPQLVRVSSDVVRPDNSRVFAERAPVICQIRMVNETPLVPDLQRLEEMIAEETSIGAN